MACPNRPHPFRCPDLPQDRTCFWENLFDSAPVPLLCKDPDGRILHPNPAFASLLGRSVQDLEGCSAWDLLPQDQAARVQAMEAGLLEKGGQAVYEVVRPLPGGGACHELVHEAPLLSRDGSPAGFLGAILDVTEQREAEARLHEIESLFSTITHHVVDLLAIVDQEGNRLYNSPSYHSVLGFPPEELDHITSLQLVHPDDVAKMRGALEDLFLRGVTQNLEYRLRCRDGRWLHFESNASLITQPSGNLGQALLVARDITARKEQEAVRKQMEVQLRHAQKLEAIGSLAAGIAHEINTPTQYIGDNASFLRDALKGVFAFLESQKGLLLSLQEGTAGRGRVEEALASLEELEMDYLLQEIPKAIQQTLDGVGRVTRIVRAMKDFSHPGLETKSPADLNRAIQSTLTVSRNEWKYVAEMETCLDPELPPVPCFQGEFNQALLNLVVNAAHAIQESLEAQGVPQGGKKGHIRVSTRRCGDLAVAVSVSDDGTGIPESLRERIFDPFFTTKPVGKGTGQGLAIVHSVIVEKHGGRIRLESAPGRGTTFRLYLPLTERPLPDWGLE